MPTSSIPRCFDNYIGIRNGCLDENGEPLPEPVSGYYISDLEGVTLELAANISKPEDINGRNLLNRKIRFGIQRTLHDLHTVLRPYLRLDTVIDAIKEGKWGEEYLPATGVQSYRGVRLRQTHQTKMTGIFISRVSVLSATGGVTLVYINDGEQWFEYEVELQPYVITTINVNYRAQSDTVYVLVDGNEVSMNEGRNPHYSCDDFCYGCSGGRGDAYNLEVTGWDGNNASGQSFGVQVEANVECFPDSLYCALSRHLGRICLYAAGIEILNEQMASKRLNVFTIYDQKDVEDMRERWEDEYKRLYDTLAFTIQPLVRNYDKFCVICQGLTATYGI